MAVNNRMAEALETLSQGVAKLTSSEEWLAHLRAQRAFHNYSFGNVMLIVSQRADATRVAGFHTWLKLGRHVMRGEHGIWILAPIVRKLHESDVDVDPDAEASDKLRLVTKKEIIRCLKRYIAREIFTVLPQV